MSDKDKLIAARKAASEFCAANLTECCAELVEWQNTAILKAGGKLRALALLCKEYVGNDDDLKVAEREVERQACEKIAASPVQGAASAPDQGAAVKPWQERYESLAKSLNNPPNELRAERRKSACRDAEIADWRALAERAQAAQPSGAVAKLEVEREFLEEWIHYATEPVGVECCGRGDGYECCMNPKPVTMRPSDWLKAMQERHAAVVSQLAATPAPAQEAAPTDEAILRRLLAFRVAGAKLYGDDGELQDGTAHPFIDFKRDPAAAIEAKLDERSRIAFAALDPEAVRRAMSSAPVEQEAAQVGAGADDPSHVVPPFAAPAGQHDADTVDAARYRWLRMIYGNRWRIIPGSVFLAETPEELDAGIDKQIAYDAASGSREGREAQDESSGSGCATATNTNQPEGEKGGAA